MNVALLLARLGWRAGLAAVVGDDALGEALAARVSARGVSTALVRRAPPRTGLCFAEPAGKGTRVVGYRSAGEEAPELGAGWRARALLLTGLAPSPEQAARFGAAASEGRRRGALVMVDLNARPRLWQGRGGAPAWIAEADVVKASEEELAAMGLDEGALRAAMGAEAVLVVTAGPRAARAIGPFGRGAGGAAAGGRSGRPRWARATRSRPGSSTCCCARAAGAKLLGARASPGARARAAVRGARLTGLRTGAAGRGLRRLRLLPVGRRVLPPVEQRLPVHREPEQVDARDHAERVRLVGPDLRQPP